METDIGTVDFTGLRSEHAPAHEPEPEPAPTHIQQDWDPVQYYPVPPSYQQPEKRDILADMDRNTYLFIFIAFIVGFFLGRGMIQPVILRGS
jgi:hypothetical protein